MIVDLIAFFNVGRIWGQCGKFVAVGFGERVGVGRLNLVAARELGEMIEGGTGSIGRIVVAMDIKGLD